MDKYLPRISDKEIKEWLSCMGAVLITGPKACGKSTSAKQIAKTIIDFQDPSTIDYYNSLAQVDIWSLFKGETPILFDEWQDGYHIWDAVRKFCDEKGKPGLCILTGSINEKGEMMHSGVGRICEVRMYPMSLYESGESNGAISLSALFNDINSFTNAQTGLDLDGLTFALCRGGWPQSVQLETNQLRIAKAIYKRSLERDITMADNVTRNKKWMERILHSYARNLCCPASTGTILKDVNTNNDSRVSESSFYEYLNVLKNLYIIEDISAWNPNVRSKTALVSAPKRNFVDPSLAVAALHLSPESFKKNFKTFGYFFESLCIRDLKIYSAALGGEVSYFRTRAGLEVDIVLHLEDGRYALFECKMNQNEIEEAASNLNLVEKKIKEEYMNSESVSSDIYTLPVFKAILVPTKYAYRRPDGVFVIPVGCLKD